MNLVYKIALVVTALVCAMIIVWDLRDADAAQQTPSAPATPQSSAVPDTHETDAQNASATVGGTTASKPALPVLRSKGTLDTTAEHVTDARVANQTAPAPAPAPAKSQQASSPVATPVKSSASTPSSAIPPNTVGQSDEADSNSAASSAIEPLSTIAAIDRPAATKSNAPASVSASSPAPAEGDHLGSFFSPQPGDSAAGLHPGQIPATYTIEPGDSFSAIAEKVYQREAMWVRIRDANPRIDPRHLTVGQVIKLPQPGSPAGATAAAVADAGPVSAPANLVTARSKATAGPARSVNKAIYVVKPGDTLSSIAREVYRDGGAWRTLYQANRSAIGANPNRLARGLKLVIPPADRDG